jgi:hypothetical protein
MGYKISFPYIAKNILQERRGKIAHLPGYQTTTKMYHYPFFRLNILRVSGNTIFVTNQQSLSATPTQYGFR